MAQEQAQAQLKCDIMLNVSMFSFLISFVCYSVRQHKHTAELQGGEGDNLCVRSYMSATLPQSSTNHIAKNAIFPPLTFLFIRVHI